MYVVDKKVCKKQLRTMLTVSMLSCSFNNGKSNDYDSGRSASALVSSLPLQFPGM